MANVDSAFGLRPVGHLMGLNWSASVREAYMDSGDANDYFIGDAVYLDGTQTDTTGIRQTVLAATVGSAGRIWGVITGFRPDPDNLDVAYGKGSTTRYPYVCIDPYVIYEIQCNGTLTYAHIGLNADLVNANSTGSTTTGLSGQELNITGINTTDTLQLHILGVSDRPDNTIGEHCVVDVLINTHMYLPYLVTEGGITGV